MGNQAARRILVVDDASLVRLYYRDALERAGFVVDEALNGIEALEKLLGAPADLVVVDVNMPKMDGLAFLDALRIKDAPLGATPALVTSSEGAPHDMTAAQAAGANFYVVKPISQEALVRYAALLCGVPHG
jgi:two-component system chemotaxis response regulator CheY